MSLAWTLNLLMVASPFPSSAAGTPQLLKFKCSTGRRRLTQRTLKPVTVHVSGRYRALLHLLAHT